MDIVFRACAPASWSAAVAVVPLFENTRIAAACPDLAESVPWLAEAPGLTDFRGKKEEFVLLRGPAGAPVPRVLLAGMGADDAASPRTHVERLDAVRATVGAAAARCREQGFETMGLPVSALNFALRPSGSGTERSAEHPGERVVEEAVCGALLGLYRNIAFKSGRSGAPLDPDPNRLEIWGGEAGPDAAKLTAAARRGEIHAHAVILARNLGNTPGNLLTPADLADEAARLAARHGLRCEVLGMRELEKNGMGAFVSVGAGAACHPDAPRARHEPRLVVLEHAPAGREKEPPLAVVGKGITFDSGGISLKPSAGMGEMKGDMGGAAAVLGLFEALARLETPRRVIGLLACAENMPGAYATRPGDVVTTRAGKTVEIVNTDAEGRLVLCDTLTYAQQRWSPDTIIDVATLTGACVVALGDDVAGLFCEDPELAALIKGIGELVGEPFWPLPLHERYFENLKSETADFANAGARAGGACSAAVFLKQFVNLEGAPYARWAHLDIAGPGFHTRKVANCPAGASGFAVRTLVEVASARIASA